MPKIIIFLYFSIIFISCSDTEKTLFTELSHNKTNIDFKNLIKETENFNIYKFIYLYNGGGVSIGDINNDGLQDIYFSGNIAHNRLYLNKGDFEFEDITEKSGVSASGAWNSGVTMADVNADGFLDIYVCRTADIHPEKRKNLLYINNGNATFKEQAEDYGLADASYSTQASFFDYDKDGDLDMFLLNHSLREFSISNAYFSGNKYRSLPYFGDKLYRNDNGKFTDVSKTSGIIQNPLGFGLGLSISDVNGDMWPDIYVGNDFMEEDYLYINNQDGTFTESIREYVNHVSMFTMGCDIADINNDLLPDILTVDMLPEGNYRQKKFVGPENFSKFQAYWDYGYFNQTMRNMLQINNGNNSFSEIGQLAGISNTDWSWSPLIADYDNDGFKDIFITNGYLRNFIDLDFINYWADQQIKHQKGEKKMILANLLKRMPAIPSVNYMYKNNKNLGFSDESINWGFTKETFSNGAAYGDLDNDGDLDLVVNNINDYASVHKNNSNERGSNAYLKIKLKGNDKNRFGLGSNVRVYSANKTYQQELTATRGFQSSVNPELIFGLGNTIKIDSLFVVWPNNSIQKLYNLKVNYTLEIDQENAIDQSLKNKNTNTLLYKKTTSILGLNHEHKENKFLDFNKERLLPQGLSTLGPKVAKGDINNDGLVDLYFCGAKNSSGKLYLQNKKGGYSEAYNNVILNDSIFEDTDAQFLDVNNDDFLDLYVVSGGSDFDENSEFLQDRLYINNKKGGFVKSNMLPKMLTSGSCITSGDIDDDGDIDLFIGGRSVPGNYPKAPRSYILVNDKGVFKDKTMQLGKGISSIGMVTDAELIDIDNDKKLDLVIVGEWLKIDTYQNILGTFKRIETNALKHTHGWWNTVHAFDADNDGDLDFIVGNMGNNNQLKPSKDKPIKMYYGDLDNNGSIDPILTHYRKDESDYSYSRDELIGQVPAFKKLYPDFESFAKGKPKDILKLKKDIDTLTAYNFKSVYIENLGNWKFNITPLPIKVQSAPIYAIETIDINKDGYKDIILGGNLSNTRVSTGKYNANHGMVLLSNKESGYNVLNPNLSGLKIKGDVRDIQEINIEGESYLIFARNNNSPVVYKIIK